MFFDRITLLSKLSFLLPKLTHTLSILRMTRLFQLDVLEEHWEGFVDIVQNWSGVTWENFELALNNVMTQDLAKIKCYHLYDDTWWMGVIVFVYIIFCWTMNVNRRNTLLRCCHPNKQLWFKFHFCFIFYFEWCCEWVSCVIFTIKCLHSTKNSFRRLKSTGRKVSKLYKASNNLIGHAFFDFHFCISGMIFESIFWR